MILQMPASLSMITDYFFCNFGSLRRIVFPLIFLVIFYKRREGRLEELCTYVSLNGPVAEMGKACLCNEVI